MYIHHFPYRIDTESLKEAIDARVAFERLYPMLDLPFQNIEYKIFERHVELNKYDYVIKQMLDIYYDKYIGNYLLRDVDTFFNK